MRLNIHDSMWLIGIGMALLLSVLFDELKSPLSFAGVIFIVRGFMGMIKTYYALGEQEE